MNKEQKEALADYLDAFNNDNLSDGAWQGVLMEGVEQFNEDMGLNIDPHEGFLIYVEIRGERI